MSQPPLMFHAQVNKGRISMEGLTTALNMRWENGWYLFHIFEQHGNTVMVWASRTILGHVPPPVGSHAPPMGPPPPPPPPLPPPPA